MRVVSANFFALLFMCTCASVFYVWSTLENRLERYKRRLQSLNAGYFHPDQSTDLSSKTFRALLAVPVAQRAHLGGRLGVHNLTGERDQPVSLASRDYHMNVDNKGSTQREGPKFASPVEDGIFWSEWLENHIPLGFTEEYARSWREKARGHRIVKLEPGCGRISNQLATFSDGTKACVRYGINADQVQGETLTYYLASLLGITNVPPLILARLDVDSDQWAAVRRRIDGLQWGERAVVSLTKWVSNLTGVAIPAPLRQVSGGGANGTGSGLHPLRTDLWNGTTRELLELAQWTDLLAFDYVSANFDRLVSNVFSLQWDARAMERDASNLLREAARSRLVFVDNEAGLVHGFRVLRMWETYHDAALRSACVFRRRTARRVAELHRRRDAGPRLLQLYRDNEPLAGELGFLSDEHAGVLQDRIDRLYRHMLRCEAKYSQG
ncbi:four-jointed box protein 1 [Lampris incognitus]|uniref:four-jointed box protein 1 n=1 Tax=Lampris incognitus TaxID=2546036 RepID=UPI0024B48C67|nr:four-jointed box protein 1 [Lampris incognitus]